MTSPRQTALVAGLLFLLTEVGAIAGTALYSPVLSGIDYVTSAGADDRILLGALFEILLVVAAVGTAVTLYPVLRRQSEGLALAFVVARVLEAVAILIGILSLLTIVSIRRDYAGSAGTNPDALMAVASSLLSLHEWTFLFGPNFALGVASLLLAYLMYASGLVPRAIAVLGLVGGTLILLSAVAVMFGVYGQMSTPGLVVALPVFAWELSLAGYLIVKGFRAASILATVSSPAAPVTIDA